MAGEYPLKNGLQTDWKIHDSTWKKGVDQNWKHIDWKLYKVIDEVVPTIAGLPSNPTNYQSFLIEDINEVWVWNENTNSFDKFSLANPFLFYDLNLSGWYQWIAGVISPAFPSAGGDVFGPSSAIDGNICIFDGPSGKIIEDSGFSIADLLGAGGFEPGTKLPFYQASSPTGWTLDTTVNDRFIRISNSAGGSIGGSFSGLSHSHAMPHSHTGETRGLNTVSGAGNENSSDYRIRDDDSGWVNRVAGSRHIVVEDGSNNEGQHDHLIASETVSTSSQTLTHGSAQHAYANFIICSKD